MLPGLGSQASLLRLLRLLRVMKLLKMIEQLQIILSGLVRGLSSIIYIAILLFLCFYLFAIMVNASRTRARSPLPRWRPCRDGALSVAAPSPPPAQGMMAFEEADPLHFGGLGSAMVSLFRAATMEDWSDLMYISMLGCGEYGYPALDVSGWLPSQNGSARPQTVTAFCKAAPLGDRKPNATALCGGPIGSYIAQTNNNRGCYDSWETYLETAHNKSWPMWLGSETSTWVAPFYYIFFLPIAGIVMLSLFVGAVTLGMQNTMNETTEAKEAAKLER